MRKLPGRIYTFYVLCVGERGVRASVSFSFSLSKCVCCVCVCVCARARARAKCVVYLIKCSNNKLIISFRCLTVSPS